MNRSLNEAFATQERPGPELLRRPTFVVTAYYEPDFENNKLVLRGAVSTDKLANERLLQAETAGTSYVPILVQDEDRAITFGSAAAEVLLDGASLTPRDFGKLKIRESIKRRSLNGPWFNEYDDILWSSLNFPVKSPYGSPRSVKLLIPPTCLAGEARCEAPRLS